MNSNPHNLEALQKRLAAKQDYRGWLRANALAEQRQFAEISERCEGYIIIGRAADGRDEDGQRSLADLRQSHIEVASYDRLLAEARHHFRHQQAGWKETTFSTVFRRSTRWPTAVTKAWCWLRVISFKGISPSCGRMYARMCDSEARAPAGFLRGRILSVHS